jgi:integrase
MQRRPRTTEWRPWKRGTLWSARRRLNGVRESRPTGQRDKKAAITIIARWNREAADPIHEAADATTFGDAVDRFLDDAAGRDLAEATKSIMACKAGHLVRIIAASRSMSAVTAKTVDTYTKQRLDEGASRSTIAKELCTLRGVLASARRRGEFAYDPVTVLPHRWGTGYVPRTRWLTREQADKLVAALPPHHAARIEYTLGTGGRDGEVERARPHEDVDWTAGEVRIRGTKTRASKRTIPITLLMRPYLERALKGVAPGMGFLPWGNRNRDMATACKRAGIPRASMNDLRRSFASWHLHAGVSTYVVSRMLGHTSSTMIERVYGQQNADTLRKLVDDQLAASKPQQPSPDPAPSGATTLPASTAAPEEPSRGARVIPISSAPRRAGR